MIQSSIPGLLFMMPPETSLNNANSKIRQVLQQLENIRFNGGEPVTN